MNTKLSKKSKVTIQSAVKMYCKSVKNIDYICAEQFAKERGFIVVLFNTDFGNRKLVSCNCVELAQKHKSFTHFGDENIIFINGDLSPEDRLYLLLHEIGHILLIHIGDGKRYTRNGILIDVEANAFVYGVLYYKKLIGMAIFRTCITLLIGIAIGMIAKSSTEPHAKAPNATETPIVATAPIISVAPTPTVSPLTNQMSDVNSTDIVYVTHSGNKFHRADCRYTKDKECTAINRADAVKEYSPCKICNP